MSWIYSPYADAVRREWKAQRRLERPGLPHIHSRKEPHWLAVVAEPRKFWRSPKCCWIRIECQTRPNWTWEQRPARAQAYVCLALPSNCRSSKNLVWHYQPAFSVACWVLGGQLLLGARIHGVYCAMAPMSVGAQLWRDPRLISARSLRQHSVATIA